MFDEATPYEPAKYPLDQAQRAVASRETLKPGRRPRAALALAADSDVAAVGSTGGEIRILDLGPGTLPLGAEGETPRACTARKLLTPLATDPDSALRAAAEETLAKHEPLRKLEEELMSR